MAAPTRFEDQVKWRFTRCLNDVVIKGIAATAFSVLGAKMFLKKRVTTKGATLAGFGIAIGMSYHNCEREMQLALTSPCEKKIKKKVKGEDDCLELEKDDKKAEKISADKEDSKKQPVELKNDKAKAKKADESKGKKDKVEDLKNESAKKPDAPKSDKSDKKTEDVKDKNL